MKLTDQQRRDLYKITAEAFNRHRHERPIVALVRARREITKELRVGLGWEEILVAFVIAVVVKLMEMWIKGDIIVEPAEMPDDFFN